MYNYNIYLDDLAANIEMYDEEFKISGGKNAVIRKASVTSLEKLGNLPMAKVAARMEYYSIIGDKNVLEFRINEMDFKSLKKDLKK